MSIEVKKHSIKSNLLPVSMAEIPFEVKRIFHVVADRKTRGGHAHKQCRQYILCLHGEISASVYIIKDSQHHVTDNIVMKPGDAFLLEPGNFIVYGGAGYGSNLLVFCSHEYDLDDYIHDPKVVKK